MYVTTRQKITNHKSLQSTIQHLFFYFENSKLLKVKKVNVGSDYDCILLENHTGLLSLNELYAQHTEWEKRLWLIITESK